MLHHPSLHHEETDGGHPGKPPRVVFLSPDTAFTREITTRSTIQRRHPARRLVFGVAKPPDHLRIPAPEGTTIMRVEGIELAKACAKAADEIQAEDIKVWDLRGVSTLTDFMIVCSGSSMPHLRAIMRDVAGFVEEWHDVKPVNSEGKVDSRWVVLDYIDVMVHVMHAEMRDFYGLENLWGDAKLVEWQDGETANSAE